MAESETEPQHPRTAPRTTAPKKNYVFIAEPKKKKKKEADPPDNNLDSFGTIFQLHDPGLTTPSVQNADHDTLIATRSKP